MRTTSRGHESCRGRYRRKTKGSWGHGMKDFFVEAFTFGVRVDLLPYALRCHCARFHI
jgi:hypothetical protein